MDFKEIRNSVKSFLRDYVESVTEKSKGRNMYVCPLCKSGTGKNKTGAFSIEDNGLKWHCFACNKGGDIIDLISQVESITNHIEAVNRANELYGRGDYEEYRPSKGRKQDRNVQYTDTHTAIQLQAQPIASEEPTLEELRLTCLEAQKHIAETDYPAQRGLSNEVVSRFKLGYIAEWRNPKAPANVPTSPRLIIPTDNGSYVARDTRSNLTGKADEYKKLKAGRAGLFNKGILYATHKPIYVVEGEIDAMSIIEAGSEAIAIGGVTGVRLLLAMLESKKPTAPLIIALDNDKVGVKATKDLCEGLDRLGLTYYCYSPNEGYKDANEALIADREGFIQSVANGVEIAGEKERVKAEEYLKTSNQYYLDDFINNTANINTACIPTGYPELDKVLGGGLYEGLYILGAISSLGKTTFLTQMADQIAQNGHDVLLFSLEMSRTELIAKSLSRETVKLALVQGVDLANAKTVRGITDYNQRQKYNSVERLLFSQAVEAYSSYSGKLYISEGVGDIGVTQIRETVEKHIRYTGRKPIIVIDYLQILAPYNERCSDKQNTDKAVVELKRLSRDYKLPVIAISSFNRENYKTQVSMIAFKESGAIEYGSDVLIGLQLLGQGSNSFDYKEAKRRDPREIELRILKNRNGAVEDTILYNYYPRFNYYRESIMSLDK